MLHIIKHYINRMRYMRLTLFIKRPFIFKLHLPERLREEGYFSQSGQDKWIVEKLFPGKRGGVFVDIGAYDGICFSNTFFLEKERDWRGLAIEPNPHVYEKLQRNRSCSVMNCCVGEKDGCSIFRAIQGYPAMLSGMTDQYHPKHLNRIDRELRLHGGDFQDIDVPCYSINSLFSKYKLYTIDYLSIDVEGAELPIIKGLDVFQVNISVMSVENNYKDYKIPQILKQKGFVLHSTIGLDELYINRELSSSFD